MLFKDIIGLSDTKQTLLQAVSKNHVAHAQLFHGAVGTANLPLALAFATYLNCEDQQPEDACGRCASCVKMSKLAHPDVVYLFPTAGAKTNTENLMPAWRKFAATTPYGTVSDWLEQIEGKQGNIPAEEARKLLERLSLKAYEASYKIVLIWQAEMLHTSAANALLKILEEPPEKTIFLLVTNDAEKLLVTILSRTQRIAVRKFTDEEIIAHLEKQQIGTERAKQIAFLAEGSIAKATEIANQSENDQHNWFANWMRMCYSMNIQKLIGMADEFDAFKKEEQKALIRYGLTIFRELFLSVYQAENLIRLEGEELTFVQKFSKAIQADNIEKIVSEFGEAHFHLERNGRAKMIFLDGSLRIGQLMK